MCSNRRFHGNGLVVSLGIDFGTSGARAIALSSTGQILAQTQQAFDSKSAADPQGWQQVLWQLLADLPQDVRQQLQGIAINGTSATVLLCDRAGNPLTAPLLYNDARGGVGLDELENIAPEGSPALSATSSLAKALWWQRHLPAEPLSQARYLLHQADWLSAQLHSQWGISDYHNALKLGYDVAERRYPDWLLALPIANWLPTVKVPGSKIAPILPEISRRLDLPATCQVYAGTTDSIAAFLASGAQRPGEAVTSLGSTLVLKLLSPCPVNDSATGVYSHRLGDLWLAGGASNSGGAVLKQFFPDSQLSHLSQQIDLSQPCPYDYYPLPQPGERFPVNDPAYAPRLTPRPDSDVAFLYGLLDGIARIEATGYRLLQRLGAPAVQRVYTAGGGAQNWVWQELRSRHLRVPVCPAGATEAAYGAARLAQSGDSLYL